jgi:hypothetical protein
MTKADPFRATKREHIQKVNDTAASRRLTPSANFDTNSKRLGRMA